uniref:Chromosome 8 open reading frame 34 n=1 Tax=Cyprinus carpio TaxID=7962 RepID=A0A8C2FYY4_CYPCA
MASLQQSRIQSYLEKNKIGPLFEEMMTKLITETPDHPIPFLIGHLQTKQESPGRIQRTLSGSAALWAESSSEYKGTRRDSRGYEKPWQIHPKKPKKSKSDLAMSNISPPSPESKSLPRSILRPTWDWRTKPESRDFDELNHILQESKKLGKALENLSRSIAVSDDFELDPLAYNSILRPRVVGEWVGREEEDSDPLAAEMLQPPVPRAKTEGWVSKDNSPVGSLKMETKGKGLKQQQQNHKKLLAAMLSQDSFDSMPDSAPSVTEDEMEDEDDAMELLEDLDDLRMEGVTGLMLSGSKFSQGRSSYFSEPQAKVTLNICSRCARLQGDSLTARSEEEPTPHVPEQAVPEIPCPLPAVTETLTAAEDLQTASQVTGQRHPVWASDVKPIRGTSPQTPRRALQLQDSLFSKELENMGKHLAGRLLTHRHPHAYKMAPFHYSVTLSKATHFKVSDFPTSPNQPKDQSDQVGRPENELMLVLKDFFIFIFSSKDVQQGSEIKLHYLTYIKPSCNCYDLCLCSHHMKPWRIPSDTESDCLEPPEQDKCEIHLSLKSLSI